MKATIIFIAPLLLALTLSPVFGQNQAKLSLKDIMKGTDFIGTQPTGIYWSEDGKDIYFNWNPDQKFIPGLYKYNISSDEITIVSLEAQASLPSSSGKYNSSYTKKIYSKNGDIFILDIPSGSVFQVTNTIIKEKNPMFLNGDRNIAYEAGNNIFLWDTKTGLTKQLTNIVNGKKKKKQELSKQKSWLENDQVDFFDILSDQKDLKNARDSIQNILKPKRPEEFYLNGNAVANLTTSPNGKFISFRLSKAPTGDNETIVLSHVTKSGYTSIKNARPKVGSPGYEYSFYIYDLESDTIFQLDEEQIPGIYDKPEYLKDYTNDSPSDTYDLTREVIIHGPFYNHSGSKAAVVIRSIDNKDRWIMLLDPKEGKLSLVDRQRDEAWVGGPGISEWNFDPGTIGWLGDDKTMYFQSEETGYSHLYLYDIEKKQKKQITNGQFEIREVKLSKDKKHFYIRSNKVDPSVIQLYKLQVKGGAMKQITSLPGNQEAYISPDESLIAIKHSYSNKPGELFLMKNKPGTEMSRITNSTTEEFNAYPWRDPEIIEFVAEDGQDIRARLYKPDSHSSEGPAVIFVHGAGYLQNVHQWWSSYYREYMFHNLLVDNGYTVLDIDYRGSDGYGRDFRTGVYRHMGGKDLTDHVDGAKYLIEKHGIDPEKIGIYGGSYGGFITIFAMFNYPEIFKCGAALRSVTDWAHYNHGYTSNRLNTPVADSIAYHQSSPIYYAEGLKGELLMLHGMVDTNVHFQDVVRLSQKLIELEKDNWDVAIFPVEGHGFKEASSWADEYRRIFELFERNLK